MNQPNSDSEKPLGEHELMPPSGYRKVMEEVLAEEAREHAEWRRKFKEKFGKEPPTAADWPE